MVADILRRLSDVERPGSFANRMRGKRFQRFEELASRLPRPISILDIGGTVELWIQRGWADKEDVQITLVNIQEDRRKHTRILSRIGDATDLCDFSDKSIDVVFSNSVIEHLCTRENQAAMAKEIMRVGRDFWVQTPNWWFPMEPHFQVPGWQWMPRSLRIRILMRRACGRRGPCATYADAASLVDEIRLLTGRELADLFPTAQVVPERLAGLVKSWIVHSSFRQ